MKDDLSLENALKSENKIVREYAEYVAKLRENSPVLQEMIAISDALDEVRERLCDFRERINPSGDKCPWTDYERRRPIPYSCAEFHVILGVIERRLEDVIETLDAEITLVEGGGEIAVEDLKKIDEAYSALSKGEIDYGDDECGISVDEDGVIEINAEIIED